MIIATEGINEKLNLAKSLGADVMINYNEEDWADKIRSATAGKGADLILESVGGEFRVKNLDCLALIWAVGHFGSSQQAVCPY